MSRRVYGQKGGLEDSMYSGGLRIPKSNFSRFALNFFLWQQNSSLKIVPTPKIPYSRTLVVAGRLPRPAVVLGEA